LEKLEGRVWVDSGLRNVLYLTNQAHRRTGVGVIGLVSRLRRGLRSAPYDLAKIQVGGFVEEWLARHVDGTS